MPYKSDAQRKKFHVMMAQGMMSPKTVAEFDHASKGMDLPEYVGQPKHPHGGRTEKKVGKTKHGHEIMHSER